MRNTSTWAYTHENKGSLVHRSRAQKTRQTQTHTTIYTYAHRTDKDTDTQDTHVLHDAIKTASPIDTPTTQTNKHAHKQAHTRASTYPQASGTRRRRRARLASGPRAPHRCNRSSTLRCSRSSAGARAPLRTPRTSGCQQRWGLLRRAQQLPVKGEREEEEEVNRKEGERQEGREERGTRGDMTSIHGRARDESTWMSEAACEYTCTRQRKKGKGSAGGQISRGTATKENNAMAWMLISRQGITVSTLRRGVA